MEPQEAQGRAAGKLGGDTGGGGSSSCWAPSAGLPGVGGYLAADRTLLTMVQAPSGAQSRALEHSQHSRRSIALSLSLALESKRPLSSASRSLAKPSTHPSAMAQAVAEQVEEQQYEEAMVGGPQLLESLMVRGRASGSAGPPCRRRSAGLAARCGS